jgi:hypothetical protein
MRRPTVEAELRERAIKYLCPVCEVDVGRRWFTGRCTFDAPVYPPSRNLAECRKYPPLERFEVAWRDSLAATRTDAP